MGCEPVLVALKLTTAPDICGDVGLSLGWGPTKTKLVLPTDCDPEGLLLSRKLRGEPLPDIVQGFKACLGVPRAAPYERREFHLGCPTSYSTPP